MIVPREGQGSGHVHIELRITYHSEGWSFGWPEDHWPGVVATYLPVCVEVN